MTNNGDVEDLEMTEIFSRWRRFLGDDGDLHESYFLEPGQGWEDEDVDCVTVGDGNTDEDSGVQMLPICWRQIEQKVRQPGIY